MPLQLASLAAGVPAWHESTTPPFVQVVAPAARQAPTPQLVGAATKSSSTWPSQSSSMALQTASFAAGALGWQSLVSTPATHRRRPVAVQAPTPQMVGDGA